MRVGRATLVLLLGGCHLVFGYGPSSSPTPADGGARESGSERGAPGEIGGPEAAVVDQALDGPPGDRIFVDAAWAGQPAGAVLGPGLRFGLNAFATIGEALAAARPGGTVQVAAGSYFEALKVSTANLRLQGIGRPVLDGDAADDGVPDVGPLIAIEASSVEVSGFALQQARNGILVNAAAQPLSGVVIRDNVVHDMYNLGGSRGYGIALWGACEGALLENNRVYANDRQGIYVGASEATAVPRRNAIVGNEIYDNGRYRFAEGPDRGAYGVQIYLGSDNSISGNAIHDHRSGGSGAAIHLQQASSTLVSGNRLWGNGRGLHVTGDARHELSDNDLHQNETGVDVAAGAVGLLLARGNRFCGNTTFGASNGSSVAEVDATGCWWGATDGPRPTGSGDAVKGKVTFTPFVATAPPAGPCAPAP